MTAIFENPRTQVNNRSNRPVKKGFASPHKSFLGPAANLARMDKFNQHVRQEQLGNTILSKYNVINAQQVLRLRGEL